MNQTQSAALLLISILCGLASGCGGSGGNAPLAPPTISSQPSSQTVDIGGMTTFAVVADGTPPLAYQWNWNGMAIAGHGSASISLPAAVPSDNLSAISVTVTNAEGSVTSQAATLHVNGGPRPPKPGDLRFHDVDAFPLGIQWNLSTAVVGHGSSTFTNQAGSPLEIGWPGPVQSTGQQDMGWNLFVGPLPEGAPTRTTKYLTGILSNFPTDLASLVASDTVITSLDFDAGENGYGVQVVQTTAGDGGYVMSSQTLASSGLPGAAAQEGALGRVITALSLNAGQVTYVSYGWQGDPSTVYETNVANATTDTLVSVASNLAQAGYFITGFGGNDQDGFILVGTRVQGDSTPRPINQPLNQYSRGYSPVIYVFNPNNSSAPDILISQM